MADEPAIDDLLDANYGTQAWNQSNKVNRNAAGTLVGALPEATAASRPTAEYGNGVSAGLRQVSEFVRGVSEVTALHIATTLRLPRFTTAGRPAAGTSGRMIYDTDLDTILVDDGAAWDDLGGTGTGAANSVLGVAGNASTTRADITFGTDGFVLRRSGTTVGAGLLAAGAFATGPGIVTPAMLDNGAATSVLGRSAGTSGVRADISISALGLDQTLFTAHTTAGPASTTTPTDIMSQSIAASTLSADGQALEVFLAGDDFNQSGVGITWEIAILLGGVEIYRDTTNSRASSTTRRPWRLSFTMRRLSSTTLHMSGQFASFTSATAPDTGLGDLTAAATMDCPLSSAASSPTVAWGSSQTLQVRITASTNGANTDFTRRQYSIKRTAVA